MILNVAYNIYTARYRFDFLVAIAAFFTWVKTIFQFRLTMQFGPTIKIMYKMVEDLVQFLVIWTMSLLAFTCVSIIAFGQCKTFQSFESAFLFYM